MMTRSRIILNDQERTGYLPQLIAELVHPLRVPRSRGTEQVPESRRRAKQGPSLSELLDSHDCR